MVAYAECHTVNRRQLLTIPLLYHILVHSYVLGHDAMRKMGATNVLISGMKGLGIEIGSYISLY